jgi:uncharacterized membrane protein YfhO
MIKILEKFWPYLLIILVALLFFFPVFKGQIPFPGDLLVNENPYRNESFLGFNPGSYPNKAQGPDVITEIYPWRQFSVQELKKGNIPFWNPYNFSGNPQMANFQTAIFYPLNIFYYLFSFNLAWTIIIFLQHILAGIFMYLFLKKSLKLEKFASLIGGIAFAFCSSIVVWLEYGNIGHTLLWLPLTLLFVERVYKKLNIFNYLALVLILSFTILAGYIQMAFYIFLIAIIYYFYLLGIKGFKRINLKKTTLFLLVFIFPIFLTAYQLLPTLALFSSSTRGAYSLSQIGNMLMPIKYLVTIFAPDFFGNPATRNYWIDGTYIERVMFPGILILFFATLAISKAKHPRKLFFLITAFIVLILTTNLPGVKYFYLLPIPVITTTIATRALAIFVFCIVVLAAIGIDYWHKSKQWKTLLPIFFVGMYLLILVITFLWPSLFSGGPLDIKVAQRNLLLPTFFAILCAVIFYFGFKFKKIAATLFTIILILDLFYSFNKITPFAPSSFTYPKTPVMEFIKGNAGINRFWGYGSAYVPSNFQSVDGSYSPEGNDPLHIKTYSELLASSKTGNLPQVLPRPDANIAPGYGTSDLRENLFRQRILNLLGVKYILHKNEAVEPSEPDVAVFTPDIYKLVWNKSPLQIYENKKALPRYLMFNKFIVIKNKKEVLSKIYDKNINLNNVLILEEKPSQNIDILSKNSVRLLSYKPNKVQFYTSSTGNSLLFISDNYYPEWKVKIDGVESKLLVADYSFRAVAVPKGEHKVEFIYFPEKFYLGLKIAAFGIIFLGIFLFIIKKYEDKI